MEEEKPPGWPAGARGAARRGAARGWRGPGWASAPSPAAAAGAVGERCRRSGGRAGCAGSLRAALAHGPLRNRQRRGFPGGGSLSSTITHSRAPPRLTKWRRPWIRRRPLPGPILCEARDLSTWNTSAEDASNWEARVRGRSPRGRCRRLPGALLASPSRSLGGRARREGEPEAEAGRSGDSRRGDSGPGSGGTSTGGPAEASAPGTRSRDARGGGPGDPADVLCSRGRRGDGGGSSPDI